MAYLTQYLSLLNLNTSLEMQRSYLFADTAVANRRYLEYWLCSYDDA